MKSADRVPRHNPLRCEARPTCPLRCNPTSYIVDAVSLDSIKVVFLSLPAAKTLVYRGHDPLHGLARQIDRRRQADKTVRNLRGPGQGIARRRGEMLMRV